MSGQGTDSWSSACNARDNGQTDGTSTVIIQQGCIRDKILCGQSTTRAIQQTHSL